MSGRHLARTGSALAFLASLGSAASAGGQIVPARDTSQLRRLHDAVVAESPELAALRSALETSRARASSLGFSAPWRLSAELQEVPSGVNVAQAGSARVELGRDFLPVGTSAASRAVAARDIERAELELILGQRHLRIRAEQLLVQAAAARAVARRIASEDTLLSAVLEGLQVRFAVADARYVDVLRLRTERLRVQAELADVQAETRRVQADLRALLGPRNPPFPAHASLLDSLINSVPVEGTAAELPVAPSLDSLIALAPELRRSEVAVARAHAQRALTGTEHHPALGAGLGAQRFTSDGGGHSVGLTLSASISLPFLSGRARSSAAVAADRFIAHAEALRAAARARSVALAEIANERYQTARGRFAIYSAALSLGARDERDAALSAYRAGQMSLMELLDFERELVRAESGRYRSLSEAAEAFAALLSLETESTAGVGFSLSGMEQANDR